MVAYESPPSFYDLSTVFSQWDDVSPHQPQWAGSRLSYSASLYLPSRYL